jgi:hypothetical protein
MSVMLASRFWTSQHNLLCITAEILGFVQALVPRLEDILCLLLILRVQGKHIVYVDCKVFMMST